MSYSIKELYFTLQGEGAQAGRAAVFLRFSGCNLWSGRDGDRGAAQCAFCDTDFVGTDGPGGGQFSNPHALAEAVSTAWRQATQGRAGVPYVVCTGGEPLLQLDEPLLDALKERGFEIGLETNGTLAVPPGVDWICVSPKAGTVLVQDYGEELKLIYPQSGLEPTEVEDLAFEHFFLQPMDPLPQTPRAEALRAERLQAATAYCLAHPKWKLSLQTHKLIGLR